MTEPQTRTPEYFLSYSRADEAFALRFADDLIASGVTIWVDQYDIRPSQHWDSAIEAAVRRCGGMLVVLSPRSVGSANVADEVAVAIDSGKCVIPILIERCFVPLRMTRMQLIDATADYDRALQKCLHEIRRLCGPAPPAIQVSHPQPEQQPAPIPTAVAGVSPDALRSVVLELTRFLGPIAAHVARREAESTASAEQLRQRLSLFIPSETERAAFLKATKAN
ncbi:MAG TPA: toll/interleukin-1 receptor domain-containing protein [Sphingomonas sp.]|nr:toll/interleukin-1 receptor domain-containing protein [Sphingomonas sp.]